MVYRYEKEEKKLNVWETLKEYINDKKIGETITRKELIYHIYKGPMPGKFRGSYGSTLDNYRRLFTKLNVLEHTGRGEYKINHHIREDLTTPQLKLLVENGMTVQGRK